MTPPTAFITHDDCLGHKAGERHPESPRRLEEIRTALEGQQDALGDRLLRLTARHATREDLELAHPADYIERIHDVCLRASESDGLIALDADTVVSPGSWAAAMAAAGAQLTAVDAVLEGRARNAFCAVRPPGHHALADRAMGFCLFNNVAIGALYARRKGLERALIVDWDVHHGNGTEAIFYADPSVYYISMHQSPHYPGTGAADDRGSGAGEATTLNLPVGPGMRPERYVKELLDGIKRATARFTPDIVFISAGFDAVAGDPLAGLTLRPQDFGHLTRQLMGLADEVCGGRLVSTLEGGYNLALLNLCSMAHVRALAGLDA